MPGEGPLLTIAQISVALAGFSSLVIAFRGSGPDAWSPQDRFGLGNVLGASVGTLLGSLLPFPLMYLGWSAGLVWGIVDVTLGVLILAGVGFLTFAVTKRSVAPRRPRVFWIFVGSGYFVAALLFLSAGGFVLSHRAVDAVVRSRLGAHSGVRAACDVRARRVVWRCMRSRAS